VIAAQAGVLPNDTLDVYKGNNVGVTTSAWRRKTPVYRGLARLARILLPLISLIPGENENHNNVQQNQLSNNNNKEKKNKKNWLAEWEGRCFSHFLQVSAFSPGPLIPLLNRTVRPGFAVPDVPRSLPFAYPGLMRSNRTPGPSAARRFPAWIATESSGAFW